MRSSVNNCAMYFVENFYCKKYDLLRIGPLKVLHRINSKIPQVKNGVASTDD